MATQQYSFSWGDKTHFLTVLNHKNPAQIQIYFNKPQASFTETQKKPSHKLTGYNNEEINQVLSKSMKMASHRGITIKPGHRCCSDGRCLWGASRCCLTAVTVIWLLLWRVSVMPGCMNRIVALIVMYSFSLLFPGLCHPACRKSYLSPNL